MIYGERIIQARELRGLKQDELAEKVGVSQSAIARIENGTLIPSAELLKSISNETGFLNSFFEQEPIEFPSGTLNFRSNLLSSKEETKVYQYAKLFYEQAREMAKELRLPPNRLSQLDDEDPVKAAAVVRASLGLSPDMPIKNLVKTIEKNGIIVFLLPLMLPKLDAFSTWVELDCNRPAIAITLGRPTDRLRFSIAHEIGHLVLHRKIKGTVRTAEQAADAFAASFLLPESSMRRDLVEPISLTSVARLKPKWGVSMQALVYRARELGIITERQYRYLFQQISARGWKKDEPDNLDLQPEKPELIRKMAEALFNDVGQYANSMNLREDTAMELFLFL